MISNYDAQKGEEEKLKTDIENVKLVLQKLRPEPKSLLLKEQQRDGEPQIKNRGLFDVKIDRHAVSQILLACGFPQDSLQEVHIEFRAGTLADRNFWGQVAAGIRIDGENGGQTIEIYTSLPDTILTDGAESSQALERIRTTNFAFKKEHIVISLLEELRHSIQVKLDLFDIGQGSFEAQNVDDLRSLDFEADAEKFTKELAKYLLPFIEIGEYDIDGLREMYVEYEDVKDSFPKGLAKYLDTNLVARITDTDPPGLFLSQDLKSVKLTNEPEIDRFVTQVFTVLYNRKIGFTEARFLLEQLFNSLNGIGDLMKASEVQQRLLEIS